MVTAIRMREYAALADSSGPSVTPSTHCFQMSEQAIKPTLLYSVGGVIIESSTHGTFRWGFLSVRYSCSLRIWQVGRESLCPVRTDQKCNDGASLVVKW